MSCLAEIKKDISHGKKQLEWLVWQSYKKLKAVSQKSEVSGYFNNG